MFQLGRSILQSVYQNNISQIAPDWFAINIIFLKIAKKFFNRRTSVSVSMKTYWRWTGSSGDSAGHCQNEVSHKICYKSYYETFFSLMRRQKGQVISQT